ncbi:hypothetical protein ACSFE6_20035 [Pseudomonas baetica]
MLKNSPVNVSEVSSADVRIIRSPGQAVKSTLAMLVIDSNIALQ